MTSNATNPALLAAATGLGNVHWQENTRDIAKHLAEVQTNFIARRTRLAPAHARLIAERAFERRRA